MLKQRRVSFLKAIKYILLTGIITLGLMSIIGTGGGGGGSGGGGDNNSNDLLNGTYHLNQFADNGNIWTQRNQVTLDGNGNLSSFILADSSGDTGTFSGTYEIAANGTMTITGGGLITPGIVSPDGSIFSIIDTDTEKTLGIGLETSTGMGLSSLSGEYLLCQIRYNANNARIHSSRIDITADGAGAITGIVLDDSDSGPGEVLTFDYTVTPDGTLALTGTDFEGPLSSDGNIFVIMDTDKADAPDGEELLMMVGIKKSSGMSVSSLSGDYQMNQFGADSTSSWTTRIDATFNGAGTVTATILADSGGDLTAPPAMSYTVNGDGTFTITDTGERGIIAPGGNVFILVDTNAADDDVMILIGIAKS